MAPEGANKSSENNMTGSESVLKTLPDTNSDSFVDTSEIDKQPSP